jgi:hypothetical protein
MSKCIGYTIAFSLTAYVLSHLIVSLLIGKGLL